MCVLSLEHSIILREIIKEHNGTLPICCPFEQIAMRLGESEDIRSVWGSARFFCDEICGEFNKKQVYILSVDDPFLRLKSFCCREEGPGSAKMMKDVVEWLEKEVMHPGVRDGRYWR